MSRKIVFFDIDGTIWDWKRVIPDSAKEAVRLLKEKGNLAFICSGRAKGNIRAPWLLDMGFDGMVAACGAYIEIEGKIVENRLIEDSLVRKLVKVITDNRMPYVLEGPQKHWVAGWGFDKDDYVTDLYEQMGSDAITIKGYTEGIEINKFSADILVQTGYKEIKDELSEYFDFIEHGNTPDILQDEIKMSDPETVLGVVEIVPKGMSKAVGMQKVCEILGISRDDCYCVGDSMNDLEMFEAAGHAIAMGNAIDAVKDAAEWVTTGIHEDGVMNAMKHYGLI